MTSFEQAFSDTERAAVSTIDSATDLAKLAKQLQKAAKQLQKVAKEGNATAIQTIPTLVQGFNDAEKTAELTLRSATDLDGLAKQLGKDAIQLQKAAKEGNIGAIKLRTAAIGRVASNLAEVPGLLRQTVVNTVEAWPFSDEQEERYLREQYTDELRVVAARKGLDIYERDGNLISHPSIIRILPENRSVKIDKKAALKTIRPSYLAQILATNQKKPPRFPSERFLESLHTIYRLIIGGQTSERQVKDLLGTVVPLHQVYTAFTARPGSNREYDRTEFARDLYQLEANGPRQTRSGLRVSFPASTGARSIRQTFTFIGPDGHVRTYYGIRFSEGE